MPAPFRSLARLAAPGFLFLALGACSSRETAAEVNGQRISRAELDAQVRVYQSVRLGAKDDEQTRREVLDHLIKQALLVQAARKDKLDQDPALTANVADRRTKLKAELLKTAADANAQLATLDESVEAKALIDALSQRRRTGITVTNKELHQAYDLRNRREPLPPFQAVRDQLLEQVLMDRIIDQARQGALVRVHEEALK